MIAVFYLLLSWCKLENEGMTFSQKKNFLNAYLELK